MHRRRLAIEQRLAVLPLAHGILRGALKERIATGHVLHVADEPVLPNHGFHRHLVVFDEAVCRFTSRHRLGRPRQTRGRCAVQCRNERQQPRFQPRIPKIRPFKLVVYPQDILAASVYAVRAALAGLKSGAKPPMASPAELATAIRSAHYLERDSRWPDPR